MFESDKFNELCVASSHNGIYSRIGSGIASFVFIEHRTPEQAIAKFVSLVNCGHLPFQRPAIALIRSRLPLHLELSVGSSILCVEGRKLAD